MTRLVSPPHDAVSEVLRSFEVKSTVFCLSELRTPWAFRVEGEGVAKFHLVLEGSAVLDAGEEPAALTEGDLAVLPRGTAHTIADERSSPVVPLERLLAEHMLDGGSLLSYGGSGPVTRLLCGGFTLAEGIPDSAMRLLPELLRVEHDVPWLETVLAALKAEADDGRPGAGAIVTKVVDVLLAQALRTWLLS